MNTPAEGPIVHELKCEVRYFQAVKRNEKLFELRRNDRGFDVGHILRLREWEPAKRIEGTFTDEPGHYTGDEVSRTVCYFLEGGRFGLHAGFCILGLRPEGYQDPVDLIALLFDVNDALTWSRVPVGDDSEYHPKGSQQQQLRDVHQRVVDRLMKRKWHRSPGGEPMPNLVDDMVPRSMVTWLQQQLDATTKVAAYLKDAAFSDQPWTEDTEAGFRKLMDAAKAIAANPPQL